jgi:hypothetical protein
MRRALACAALAGTLLAGGVAVACGGSFGTNVTVDPHQDIIIAWKNGSETYVFQPTFCGPATAFGLILPVPAALSSEPALFEQSAFAAAVTLSEPYKREVEEQSGGIGCGGNDSSGGGMADNSTAVVASGRVGFLDWVQLKADSTTAFTKWLDDNHYPYSSSASDTFAYYVSKGWYLLAFRINHDAAPSGERLCQSLGPVALSFPSAEPVVPSRMAAASSSGDNLSAYNYSMRWRIFGITSGDSQLSMPNATDQYGGLWYSGAIQAADAPKFAGLAEPGDRLTRLLLRFSTAAAADQTLVLATPQDYRGTEDVVIQDSSCSVRPGRRSSRTFLLPLAGLAMVGLLCWRRWR